MLIKARTPDDGLNAARGIYNGTVLGMTIWLALFTCWLVFSP